MLALGGLKKSSAYCQKSPARWQANYLRFSIYFLQFLPAPFLSSLVSRLLARTEIGRAGKAAAS